MTDHSAITALIPAIYQGPLETKPWQTFLRQLRELIGCDVTALMLRPSKDGMAPLIIWDWPFETDDALVKEAIAERTRLGTSHIFTDVLERSGDICSLHETVPLEEFQQSDYYQRLLKPHGLDQIICLCLVEPNNWKCYLTIASNAAKPKLGAVEKAMMTQCLPHLEHALHTYALIKHSELEREIYGKALEQLTIGTVLIDARGRVTAINGATRELLRQHRCVSLLGDRITLSDNTSNTRLQRLLKDAQAWRAQPQSEDFVDVMRVENRSGPSLSILVRTAPRSELYPSDNSPCVILYLNDGARKNTAPEQIVARLFGLTAAEVALALLLAEGCTLAQAAAKLELTENSARTCSKRIFAKTGVSRQAELVRLILSSVALLAGHTPPGAGND